MEFKIVVKREELVKLLLDQAKIRVKTQEEETVYLEGVSHYTKTDVLGVCTKHKFDTLLHLNGRQPTEAKIDLSSPDGKEYQGTVTYDRVTFNWL